MRWNRIRKEGKKTKRDEEKDGTVKSRRNITKGLNGY